MCAEEIRNKFIEGGIAIWNGSGFDKGPNFDTFPLEMELSKAATGVYHPHLYQLTGCLLNIWSISICTISGRNLPVHLVLQANSIISVSH
jgi:hypothetical protein